MKIITTLVDDSVWEGNEIDPPPIGGMPDPVDVLPEGTEYGPDTVGRFGRIWDDMYLIGESRTKELYNQFDNMIQPGNELYYKDGKYRCKGKPVVEVLGTEWETKMRELMGDTVFARFQRDGYGFMDHGDTRLYCLFLGCDVVRELDTLVSGGQRFSLVQAQDYDNPVDQSLNPIKDPHLFHTQVLVSSTASRDYNILNDRGAVGGNGLVQFPVVVINRVPEYADVPLVGIEQYKIAFFPRPPFTAKLYRDSLVVDNVWRTPGANEGVEVTIEKLWLSGSDVYGLVDGLWYLLDQMLIRGSYDTPALHGDMDDRRVFIAPWKLPPGAPNIGWTYKHYPVDYPWPRSFLDRVRAWLRQGLIG